MTTIAIADPFATPHELIADQLEPFCDLDLARFTDHELLDAYDLAATWAEELSTADLAAMHIAAEWLVRYGRSLPRFGSDLEPAPFSPLSPPNSTARSLTWMQPTSRPTTPPTTTPPIPTPPISCPR